MLTNNEEQARIAVYGLQAVESSVMDTYMKDAIKYVVNIYESPDNPRWANTRTNFKRHLLDVFEKETASQSSGIKEMLNLFNAAHSKEFIYMMFEQIRISKKYGDQNLNSGANNCLYVLDALDAKIKIDNQEEVIKLLSYIKTKINNGTITTRMKIIMHSIGIEKLPDYIDDEKDK